MNFLTKLSFVWKRPRAIIVVGSGRTSVREAIFQVLNSYPQTVKNVLISETDLKTPRDVEELKFLISNSSLFIFVVNRIGEGEAAQEIQKLAKMIPASGRLVLNFDDEAAREMTEIKELKVLTFGFQAGADFQASDVNINGGTNFKINHKGSIVPVWLKETGSKEQIYSALAAACVATIFDLNLIEISQALKNYHPTAGKKDGC